MSVVSSWSDRLTRRASKTVSRFLFLVVDLVGPLRCTVNVLCGFFPDNLFQKVLQSHSSRTMKMAQ